MTKSSDVNPLYKARSKSSRTLSGEELEAYNEYAELRLARLKPAFRALASRKAPIKKHWVRGLPLGAPA
jgi:hypothetical protein